MKLEMIWFIGNGHLFIVAGFEKTQSALKKNSGRITKMIFYHIT